MKVSIKQSKFFALCVILSAALFIFGVTATYAEDEASQQNQTTPSSYSKFSSSAVESDYSNVEQASESSQSSLPEGNNISESGTSETDFSVSDSESDSNRQRGPTPYYTEVTPTSVIVYNFAELQSLLSGSNAYTTFYFGADIIGTVGGIVINSSKVSVAFISASATPRFTAVVVLPVPPFSLAMAITLHVLVLSIIFPFLPNKRWHKNCRPASGEARRLSMFF